MAGRNDTFWVSSAQLSIIFILLNFLGTKLYCQHIDVFQNPCFSFSRPGILISRETKHFLGKGKNCEAKWITDRQKETGSGCFKSSKDKNVKKDRKKYSWDEKALLRTYECIPCNTLVRQSRTLKKASILVQNLFLQTYLFVNVGRGTLFAGCALTHNMAVIQPFFLNSKRNLSLKFQFLA